LPHILPHKIRIIGGRLRNSRLMVADVAGLRPTADRIRESLFNWLAPSIAGSRVLDWFAGTGALGIEAISRGAAHACFVEADAVAARLLQENLQRLKISEQAQVHLGRAPLMLPSGPFDLVFLDPPFALNVWESCVQALQANQVLKPHALIYLEAPCEYLLPAVLQSVKQARAGAVQFGLYRLL
jgi:16S rRNA (guanine966-N2)-methyltransferase